MGRIRASFRRGRTLSEKVSSLQMVISDFFSSQSAYDVIPLSARVLVLDSSLWVKQAFFTLISNDVRAAPLWNSEKNSYVGMLTVSDFIDVLVATHNSPGRELKGLSRQRLEEWREVVPELKDLIYIRPNDSLFEAVRVLISQRIHRLPVLEERTNKIVCILTHKRIIRYLYPFMKDLPSPQILSKAIGRLGVGTYGHVHTAAPSSSILDALRLFIRGKVSALPIVDENGKLLDIFAKYDIINLAAQKTYDNLDISLEVACSYRNNWFKGVHSCLKSESLMKVIERIILNEIHRLVIVDKQNVVIGMISLSDILEYLVLSHKGN